MQPEAIIQQQLDAYNDRDLSRFLACFDINVQKHPSGELLFSGKEAMGEFYRDHRFSHPELHARLESRMCLGNKVIDQETIFGIPESPKQAIVMFQVEQALISQVWFIEE